MSYLDKADIQINIMRNLYDAIIKFWYKKKFNTSSISIIVSLWISLELHSSHKRFASALAWLNLLSAFEMISIKWVLKIYFKSSQNILPINITILIVSLCLFQSVINLSRFSLQSNKFWWSLNIFQRGFITFVKEFQTFFQ